MLLSRVAETVYWMARYVERAENTARIVLTHSTLMLDLPRAAGLGWEPLLAITGSGDLFYEHHKVANERNVVRFLVGGDNNPGSIIASLDLAREDLRTTRAIVPRAAWEALNDTCQYAKQQMTPGVSRRGRYDYLHRIIEHCQRLTGLLDGTMSHDQAYEFVRLGRNLERADMTTRLLDVGAANLLSKRADDFKAFDDLQWMGVLKSVSAYQMYRRHVHVRVEGPAVLNYLLRDHEFPRSVYYCLGEVESCLRECSRNEAPLRILGRAQRIIQEASVRTLVWEGLHEFIDGLQIVFGDLHDRLTNTYFRVEKPKEELVAA